MNIFLSDGSNKYYYKTKNIKKNSKYIKKKIKKNCNKNIKSKPNIGSIVVVIIKPYYKNICKKGIVKTILTTKNKHSRGHKVILKNNTIGRVKKIIKL